MTSCRGGGTVDSILFSYDSDPVPDKSVGRQDLPLDETVANKNTVRLLLSSIGAKKRLVIPKNLWKFNTTKYTLFSTALYC